ncbi:MAG TPA: GumC family protein, partial [Verrucomicrobiae bacterium]|nr:GumC family protein [Verrucomicrobiae bacterium]
MDPLRVQTPQETKLHFLDYWRIIRIRKTVILAVFLLVVITATLVTFILPETYGSSARIRVDRDVPNVSFQDSRTMPGVYDPYFIQTELETIQSDKVLTNVVNGLDLRNAWAEKYGGGRALSEADTLKILKGRLDVRPERNASYIVIRALSDTPKEAQRLAQSVAEAYHDYREDHRKELSQAGIKALETRFEEQESKIRVAQSNVNYLRKTLNIPDSVVNADQPAQLVSAETLRRLNETRIEAAAQLVREQTLLDNLSSLSKDQLEQALPVAAPDNLLVTLLQDRTTAQQRLITLSKDLGEKNPEVIKVRSSIDDLNKQIGDRVDGILLGLRARVGSLKKGLEELEADQAKAQSNDIANATISQPYFDAKRRLEELQRFGQVVNTKIAAENIESAIPKGTMVEIMDPAKLDPKPVRPNKPLNIGLGIIVGLVVGIGLAFFIEYLDTSVKTIDDVERSLQSPVLGIIPQNVGLILEDGMDSPHAEAYRVLRTNILFSRKDDKLNT